MQLCLFPAGSRRIEERRNKATKPTHATARVVAPIPETQCQTWRETFSCLVPVSEFGKMFVPKHFCKYPIAVVFRNPE